MVATYNSRSFHLEIWFLFHITQKMNSTKISNYLIIKDKKWIHHWGTILLKVNRGNINNMNHEMDFSYLLIFFEGLTPKQITLLDKIESIKKYALFLTDSFLQFPTNPPIIYWDQSFFNLFCLGKGAATTLKKKHKSFHLCSRYNSLICKLMRMKSLVQKVEDSSSLSNNHHWTIQDSTRRAWWTRSMGIIESKQEALILRILMWNVSNNISKERERDKIT